MKNFTSSILFNLRIFSITISCFTSMIVLSVLTAPVIFIFFIISTLHYRILKIKYGKRLSCPNGLDILYGYRRPNSDTCCNCIVTFVGDNYDSGQLKGHLIKILQLNVFPIENRRLRRYQQVYKTIAGYNYFIDAINFDMDYHVVEINKEEIYNDPILNKNSDDIGSYIKEEDSTDEWQILVDRIMKKYGNDKLDPNRPLWRLYYLKDQNRYTLYLKFDHVISDGVHFLRFLLAEFGDKPIVQKLPFHFHQAHPVIRLIKNIIIYFMVPFGLYKYYYNPGKSPLLPDKLSGKKTRIVSEAIPTEEVKEIKRKCKTSFNAIIFSCVAYALRCHYRQKKATIPRTYVVVPISLQDLRKPIMTKNSHGLMPILLTTETDDPETDTAIKRLKIIKYDLMEPQRDKSFLPIQFSVRLICVLMPMWINKYLLSAQGFTLGMSNIPGPEKERITLGSLSSDKMVFWIPDREPMGMGVTYFGHMGEIRVGLHVDAAVMSTNKEAYDFILNFREELNNLRKELLLDNVKQKSEIYRDHI